MTYEYVCEACGHQWEAEQSIKESPLKTCVSCGADKAKRLVSGGTGFLLKGGGWYADLYGSPGSGAGKKADDKGTKASAPKAEGSASTPAPSSASTDGKASSSTSSAASSTSTASTSAAS